MNRKAVILLSGGIDSATCLYIAKSKNYQLYPLIFDYGQRHKKELDSAINIANSLNLNPTLLKIHFPWKGSSLLDAAINIPQGAREIPNTYVPGRNIIFLSFALSFAEAIDADAIFIGAHMQDYSGYPDCRDNFFKAFRKTASLGTKRGIEKKAIKIFTPLIDKGKREIISLGLGLGVPYELTWSCYEGGENPCRKCDSCLFRERAFEALELGDPLLK
ncbi:MAG: 7-cyano-7-deazaguanine synthase QueC [Candidatus Omnitrophota bacterium]